MLLSFVIPCLNEEKTIQSVIEDCRIGGEAANCLYEIIVADNGSIDKSRELAAREHVKLINVETKGYGSAIREGVKASSGTYIIMGDADRTYDFKQAPEFLAKLQDGASLVMGNRFKGNIESGAMPILHYYLGNPVLSFLVKFFWD